MERVATFNRAERKGIYKTLFPMELYEHVDEWALTIGVDYKWSPSYSGEDDDYTGETYDSSRQLYWATKCMPGGHSSDGGRWGSPPIFECPRLAGFLSYVSPV